MGVIETATYAMKWKGLSLDDKLSIIRNAGFEAIGLGKSAVIEGGEEVMKKYLDSGMRIENVHLDSAGTTVIWGCGPDAEAMTQKYLDQIKVCGEYKIPVAIAHVTWGLSPVAPVSDAALEYFKRIVDCAEKNNVIIAFENSVYPSHVRFVLDNIKSPYAGFCFDSGHRNAFSPNEDYLGDYSTRLVAMHMQDNDGREDLHLIPFDGCADWDGIIADLKGCELYWRCVTMETGGVVTKELPGMSAEAIRQHYSHVAIVDDERLCEIGEEFIRFYGKLSFEEYIDRVHSAAMRIAERA